MGEETNILENFGMHSEWLNSLAEMDEESWQEPIAKEKWSVSEIIAHLLKWDEYLLTEVIPAVRDAKGIEFPEFGPFNKVASDYAKAGISKTELLEETKNARDRLVKELSEMPTDILTKPLPVNGVTHCPHTGQPYSLLYVIKEFTDHDHHHQRQILQFLNENNLD